MSRKLLSFFNNDSRSKKTVKVVDDSTDTGTFERRVSVSNSGRWKQKNKHRSVLHQEIFASPKTETSDKQIVQQQFEQSKEKDLSEKKGNTEETDSKFETAF